MCDSCQWLWMMTQTWVGAPRWGESHGSGVSQANWQDERARRSSAFLLLDAEWDRLSIKGKNQRLLIHIELMLRTTTWSGLSMQEKLAAGDPHTYDGSGVNSGGVHGSVERELRLYTVRPYPARRSLWAGISWPVMELLPIDVERRKTPAQGILM